MLGSVFAPLHALTDQAALLACQIFLYYALRTTGVVSYLAELTPSRTEISDATFCRRTIVTGVNNCRV